MKISELTDAELREELVRNGINVGPIMATTRSLYQKKLQTIYDEVGAEEDDSGNLPQTMKDTDEGDEYEGEEIEDEDDEEYLEGEESSRILEPEEAYGNPSEPLFHSSPLEARQMHLPNYSLRPDSMFHPQKPTATPRKSGQSKPGMNVLSIVLLSLAMGIISVFLFMVVQNAGNEELDGLDSKE